MRSDPVTHVEPIRHMRSWAPRLEQREALGLAGKAVQGYSIVRMLVRLVPGSRPDELRLKAVPWQTAGLMGRLYALAPQPADQAVCRQKLAAMNCKSSCSERIKSFPGQLRWRFFADQSIKALAPHARPAACLGESRFEAVAQRQRDAWRWVEALSCRAEESSR